LAPAVGLDVLQQVVSLPELESAQEVFYCNSLRGMRPVSSLGDRQWENHPVCEALFEQYLRVLP
jgi:4-amino-4-deoxychorismate lyase